MKTLAILLALSSLNVFATENISTHCDIVNLQKDWKEVNLFLSKDGELQSGKFELSTTKGESYEKVEIDGLEVEVVNATLLDSIKKGHYGLGGPSTTYTKVYGVKLHVSANEPIGHEIAGCIPQPINKLDTYAICYQSYTVFSRQ